MTEHGRNWKGGKTKDIHGYVHVYCPAHPHARNNYVLEHRLVMEKHIGRYLHRGEAVHHINKNVADNRISNLALMSIGEHARKHLKGIRLSSERRKKAIANLPIAKQKGKNHPSWKGGRSLPKNCVDCGKIVDRRSKLCRVCSSKRAYRKGIILLNNRRKIK